MKLHNHLPELIAEIEKKLGRKVQQKEIALESGIPEGTLSRYVNGRVGSLKLEIEYQLCTFFSDKLSRPIGRDDLFSFEIEEAS